MQTWVCLLRAVNVGSHNKVPMAALRKAMEAAGFEEVRTYLQSGNLVARSAFGDPFEVGEDVARLVRSELGVDTPVIVRGASELAGVVEKNPFIEAARDRPRFLHVVFLAGTPQADRVALLHGHDLSSGSCLVDGDHLYVDYQQGVHASKLTPQFLSRLLQVDGTARNWRTVLALDEMARPAR
ncbi:MAG: DUF1697 domain-containing protein [Acidimicrobiales bacterium]